MAAAFAALFLWAQAQSAAQAHEEIIEGFEGGARRVLVARNRIEAGTLLSRRLFDEQTWPGMCLAEGAVAAEDFSLIDGQRSASTILAGEALSRLRVFDQKLPLDLLPEGMVAVCLPADDVHALGGQILRGMQLTLMAPLSDGRVVELARGIEVLSANTSAVQMGSQIEGDISQGTDDQPASFLSGAVSTSSVTASKESLNWVTLAIPSAQVEQVLTASRAGTIHFVLAKDAADGSATEGSEHHE